MGRFLGGVLVGVVATVSATLALAVVGDWRIATEGSARSSNATVPAVIGSAAASAAAEVRRVGLSPSVERRSIFAIGSRITAQRPRAGTRIPRGSTVKLYRGFP